MYIHIPVSGQPQLRTFFSTVRRMVSAYESFLCTSRGTRVGGTPLPA